MILERGNGDGVDVAQIIWLGWPNMITNAAAQAETAKRDRQTSFHGAGEAPAGGEAAASGVGEVSDVTAGAGIGDGSGAVVESGASEAGGGNEASLSGAGNGASSFDEPRIADPLLAICPSCPLGFLADAATAG